MCQKGDIILVSEAQHGGQHFGQHPYVVLSDEAGKIYGMDFDFIALVMSSVKSERQKQYKLTFPGNYLVNVSDKTVTGIQNKDAIIVADQFFYFDKSALTYTHIGSLSDSAWSDLLTFIESFSERGIPIEQIIDNLKAAAP